MQHFRPGLGEKLLPFALTIVIVVADQITKYLIVLHVDPYTIALSLFDGLLRIIHARNPGIAFSIGRGLPEVARTILFAGLPIVVVGGFIYYYFTSEELSPLQRWSIAGIAGGGIGNLIDRIFRPEGVVDFIDVKFFGIFGLDRWPTFNVADASVVVCGILLVVSFLFEKRSSADE
jgi:signal peptidase II